MFRPNYINTSIVLVFLICVLLSVAYVTIAERKTMALMQRRLGPNIVGYYGLLQPFADALKLLIKEYIAPTQSNIILFFLGPSITLIFSLLGYAMIPFGPGIAVSDYNLGLLYMLAVSSLATYGILLAGWSANSKYAFLGSLRSTAQLISYELILSSALLVIVFLTSTLNLSVMIESQRSIWYILIVFPLYYVFFISAIAETNRAPFDLAEAESELVSGFMTEHAAGIFVFFFLAEYASIILICMLIAIAFIGGYEFFSFLYNLNDINFSLLFTYYDFNFNFNLSYLSNYISLLPATNVVNSIFEFVYMGSLQNVELDFFKHLMFKGIILSFFYSLILSFKSFFLVFTFIWVRASYPRIRFDQLMSYCWTELLPVTIAIIIFIPCILFIWNSIPLNLSIL